jgi:uncharacterized membrane protein YdbT with pleckstrin-like domain
MLSGIDQMLSEGETIEASVNPSRFDTKYSGRLLASIVLTALIIGASIGLNQFTSFNTLYGLILLVVPAGIVIWTEINREFVMYHFTGEKVVVEKGIMNKNFQTVEYGNITHTEVRQSLLERIFGVSDMWLNTAGEQDEDIKLNGLRDVSRYKSIIEG